MKTAALALACVLACAAPAYAQKTDVVTLGNGDRITGEIERLDRGRLEFSTDDAGTLYLEWDKLVALVATSRVFDISTTDGRRFLGSLGPAARGFLTVVTAAGDETLPMADVTYISPIGKSFWQKLDGSISAGFNYTRSSGIAQFNLNADTTYHRPAFEINLNGSYTLTATEEDQGNDDRGSFSASYVRFVSPRWIVSGIGRFESNESLGLKLRSQVGGGAGPRLVNTNRAQVVVGAGLVANNEQGVDVESTNNLEAVFSLRSSYFTYDRPKTTIDISLQYFPSLTDFGRQRVQLDTTFKREFLKDLILSLNLYDSFDSRPPNVKFDTNDVGIVLSLGWSF
jgi:hypothetical protein